MFTPTRSKQAFLVLLLALLLSGAQAVKDSPWHDHSHHGVDCAPCHLQAFNADIPPASPVVPAPARGVVLLPAHQAATASAFPSPYQSRAPPALA